MDPDGLWGLFKQQTILLLEVVSDRLLYAYDRIARDTTVDEDVSILLLKDMN